MIQVNRANERHLHRLGWVCAAVLLAALGLPMLLYGPPQYDDLGAFHYPLRSFYAQCLRDGEPFDWMPGLFCGFYLTGEGQAGTYHPGHWLLYRTLPLPVAFGIELWISYPWMLVGWYLFIRRHTLRRDAAVWGALVCTFAGFNLLHFVHPNAVGVMAHLPWLLWCLDIACRSHCPRRRRAAEVGCATLLASQMLLGYPQYVWYSLLAAAAYVFYLRREGAAGRWRWLRLAAVMLLGLLLGGVQLLPTYDALRNSQRQFITASYHDPGSLHPLNVLQLLAPYLWHTRVVGQNTHELGLYVGAVPLLLVLVWTTSRGRGRPKLGNAALIFAGLGLLLALGSYGLIFALQRALPIVGAFRLPCRALVLFQLGLGLTAALAWSLFVPAQRWGFVPRWQRWALVVPVAASVLLAAVGPWLWPAYTAAAWKVWAGPALLATGAALLWLVLRGSAWARLALVVFTAADLAVYGMSYAVWRRDAPEVQLPPGLPADGRVVLQMPPAAPGGPYRGNQITALGWRRADGYAGLIPARRLDYTRPAALRAAGVAWIYGQPPRESPAFQPADAGWTRLLDPLPRVRLVWRTLSSTHPAAVTNQLVRHTAVLPADDPPLEARLGGPPGVATLQRDRPGRLEILTRCAAPQLLVVAEAHHSGWRAEVNGRPTPVRRVNGDFLGCVVPAGTSRVELCFQPTSLAWGRALSVLGGAALVLWLVGPLLLEPLRHLRPKNHEHDESLAATAAA